MLWNDTAVVGDRGGGVVGGLEKTRVRCTSPRNTLPIIDIQRCWQRMASNRILVSEFVCGDNRRTCVRLVTIGKSDSKHAYEQILR
jgi:hypothetical protein